VRTIVCRIATGALLLLVLSLPWFFGGVRPVHHSAMAVTLLVGLAAAAGRLRETAWLWRSTWPTLAVLVAAIGLGCTQLSDHAADWVEPWNPRAVEIRRDFSAAPQEALGEPTPANSNPLTLDAALTRRQTADLVCAAIAFALGVAVFAESRALVYLLATTALVGAAVAFFGLVQRLSWNGQIYWTQSTEGGLPFGPFINRNNAGGFLEITLAAAVGLFVWQFFSIPPIDRDAPRFNAIPRRRPPPWPSLRRRGEWLLANLTTPLLASGTAVLVIAAGILATFSRGSVVALAVGTVAALVVISAVMRRWHAAWFAPLFILSGLALVAWLGQTDALFTRLATLVSDEAIAGEPRIVHWQTAIHAVPDFWLAGAGLGAYRFAYPRYQHAATRVSFDYAENQYLESLVTGGVIGLALFLLAWLLAAISVYRLLRKARSPVDFGIAAAGTLMLALETIHAAFDFAMFVPAYFVPFAFLCGAFAGRAKLAAAAETAESAGVEQAQTRSWPPRVATGLLLMVMAVGLVWSNDQFRRAAVARSAWLETAVEDTPQHRTDIGEVDAAIAEQQRAVALNPDDASMRIRLSDLWTLRYTREFRLALGTMPVDPLIWQWEQPAQLQSDAHLLARTRDDAGLQALRNNALVVENLKPALAEARAARRCSPMSTEALLITARLAFIDEPPADDEFYYDRAERLAGGRDDWLFEIGLGHFLAGRNDKAFAAWKRSATLSPRFEDRIVYLAAGLLTPDQLLKKVVPEDPETIVRIATTHFKEPIQDYDRKVFLRRAAELLGARTNPSATDCELRGTIEAQLGKLEEAARWFQRAVAEDGTHPEWYFEAAAVYAELNDWDRALLHARQCVRLAPAVGRYREQLARIEAEAETARSASR
jgi:tetratricopeptide (TPR) repeat protein